MTDSTQLAADQLKRMRGMNRYYHERFFSDVRFITVSVIALFLAGFWEIPFAFLLVPPLALLGAAQTAFDASYLIFSRQYSQALETYLNNAVGEEILVAHELENSYLFPINDTKLVTAAFGQGFSWFGFMTLFYTALGVVAFGFGLALGWPYLTAAGSAWTGTYVASLGTLSILALGTGWWWFVGGTGERRLTAVLNERFPE